MKKWLQIIIIFDNVFSDLTFLIKKNGVIEMFNSIFLYTFSILLLFANIYCFIKKKYLYLFFPCMLFLPDFYGVSVSDSLPLITVARIMYVIFFVYAFFNRKRDIYLKKIDYKKIPKEYFFLVAYFVLRIISNVYYVFNYGQALKTILFLIFEQLVLLIAVYILAPTKDELIVLIKTIVWSATVLFIAGIYESISGYRLFDALYTISRNIYNLTYYRLGMLRAQTTLMAPAVYGNMCILVLPFILYLYENSKSKKYFGIVGLDFLAIVHSGTRSDIIFFGVVLVIYCIYVLKGKERRILFVKNCITIAAVLLAYMGIAGACSDNLRYYYVGSGKAVLNEVGFDFDLSEGAPDGVKGFGVNVNGSVSRTRQFTGMYYVAKINPLFGLGSGAQVRHQVQYYWQSPEGKNAWIIASQYDVGLVEIFCDEGLIGLMGICFLIFYMYRMSKGNKFLVLCIICYLLSTLGTGNMYNFLILYVIIMMNANKEAKATKA